MLCWFLPYNNVNQPQLCIIKYNYVRSLLSLPPLPLPYPSWSSQSVRLGSHAIQQLPTSYLFYFKGPEKEGGINLEKEKMGLP